MRLETGKPTSSGRILLPYWYLTAYREPKAAPPYYLQPKQAHPS